MASFKQISIILAGLSAVALGGWSLGSLAQDQRQDPDAQAAARDQQAAQSSQNKPEAAVDGQARDQSREPTTAVDFKIATLNDLGRLGMLDVAASVAEMPSLALDTKVWVAHADVAALPGLETIAIVKGPATCGRLGCELAITAQFSGLPVTLLRTLGETVDIVSMNKIVINKGAEFQVVWEFDGKKFVEQ